MKKIFLSISIMLLLLLLSFEVLTESQSILKSVVFSFSIWKNNIVPSLFPFFVLSDLLINYGFVELVGELFKPFMYKLFKINGNSSFAFIMSIISGFPSNSKYVKELYLKKLINENEASKLLTFTHFSNPLFILGTLSILFLNNKKAGLLILFCHYITNIIIGIIFRNYYPSDKCNEKVSIKKAIIKMHNKRINNNLNFGQIITNSLINSINTLLLILGIVTMFLCITTIINNNITINNYNQSILNGLFEITQGLKYLSVLDATLKFKTVISTMLLSFGGLSVHLQIISILSDTKIKYIPFLIARIFHAGIASLLCFLLFDFFI